jgi:hypothetical protein
VVQNEAAVVMNLDDPFAVANGASDLANMLGEDFAFVDVVEAVAAAVAVAAVEASASAFVAASE